jgi:hypothetical protein
MDLLCGDTCRRKALKKQFLYEKALIENSDLATSIIRINSLMSDRGFHLASFSDELKSIITKKDKEI